MFSTIHGTQQNYTLKLDNFQLFNLINSTMKIQEIMDFVSWTIDNLLIDETKKLSEKEHILFQSIKISEEVGELSEQILWKYWITRAEKKDKYNSNNLEKELVDVIFSTLRLAKLLDVDIEKALKEKMDIIKNRAK